jgi:hypothetical protein
MRSAEFIGWALGGVEREIAQAKERLSALTSQANALRARAAGLAKQGVSTAAAAMPATSSSSTSASAASEGNGRKRRRRQMSPEARKRISEMMKKRWAERRKAAK